jgi:hypothetical protein
LELKNLGLTTATRGFTFRRHDEEIHGTNLLCVIPGTLGGSNSIAFVCHYDSVRNGPGASDDAAGIATLLEMARALRAGPPLPNNILLLFTDGEEAGLKGAQAFVDSSPLLQGIRVALNFEARGVSGPVFMFETSEGNGRLIELLAEAMPAPRASSLMYEVYRHMPNDTDLTVFKKAGVPGLNFGFIGEAQFYHTASDDPAHLSKQSLQHEGSYALSLARKLGGADLTDLRAGDAVYFDLFGTVLVRYPAKFALPSAIIAAALFCVALYATRKRLGLTTAAFYGGAAFWLLLPLTIALLAKTTVSLFHLHGFAEGPLWCAVLVSAAIVTASLRFSSRWISADASVFGALFWWVLLAVAVAIYLPGASFLFLWPLLFSLAAMAARNANPWSRLLVLIVSALPGLVLVTPLVRNFYLALSAGALFIPLFFLTLEFGVMSPQLQAILPGSKKPAS